MNINAILAKAIPAVEFMYDRTAVVMRYMEVVKPNGADGMDWVALYEGVPCRLSSARLANTEQGVVNEVDYDVKMFLSSSYKLLAGDKVTVDGEEFRSAREPFTYPSHQEVMLNREGKA